MTEFAAPSQHAGAQPAPSQKFAPLVAALLALPASAWETRFTLAEIETLLGEPLPHAARFAWFWEDGPVAQRNWLRAGFRGRLAFIKNHYVVLFTREFVPGA